MIWDFIIIGAAILVFIILARRIPLAKELDTKEKAEVSDDQMTTYGKISQADDYFDKKNFPKAEELYVQAAASEPNNPKIYSKLGAIYLEQKNFYDAKEAFSAALKADPDNASRHINLGLAYMGLKDYFKAAQTFQDGLKLNPKNKKYQRLLERAEKAQTREKKKEKS
jgi:Tfp pilus assembly protein PilF